MAKPQKDRQNKNKHKENIEKDFSEEKNGISESVIKKITTALTQLNQEDKDELNEKFGSGPFLDQLRKYFEEKNPALLQDIESKEKLTIYVEQLKNNGFTLNNLTINAKSLDESFKESESEYDVTKKSLKKLEDYCENEKGRLPSGIFSDFAAFANIETTPLDVHAKSKIKKASDLKRERNKFLEDQKIDLKPTQKEEMDKIMDPKYAPTTRLLVSASIKKIKKALPKELQDDFDERFEMPLTITSSIQNLNDLKNERQLFLQQHQNEIDENLAKKLDKIKVLNQDMYEEFENEGIARNKGKGFSEQEQEFRIVFNKLATRQLFDDLNTSDKIAEKQIENIGEIFKGFPPYLNEIFRQHEYNPNDIQKVDAEFSKDLSHMDEEIKKLEEVNKGLSSDTEKGPNIAKIKKIREEKNERKRAGYSKYLTSQNPKLGSVVEKLVKNKFNLNTLEKNEQQILLNDLVDEKLESVIKDGTANFLGVDQQRFETLMKEFFDLNKKQLTIPSPNGDIVFDCPEKNFLGGPLLQSLEIGSRGPMLADDDKKNLPLNMKLLLSEDNKDFFERSPIFEELFQEFKAKNGYKTLNDGYEVEVKNSKGETVKGYLSNYPPKGKDGEEAENIFKKNNRTEEHGSRYLYSKPITRPEDDRELVFRDKDKPVIIGDNEEGSFEVDIVSRELNMNGDAIGALLFGSTVGQYADENKLNTKQTKKLEEGFEKLNRNKVYKDTLDQKEQGDEEEDTTEENKEDKEAESDFDKCIEAWKKLDGYQTIDTPKAKGEKARYGFEKGAKLMVPYFKPSNLPPNKESTAGFFSIEITDIDEKNKTFKVKFSGGETKLGNKEGEEKTLPLSADGLKAIKDAFGDKAYKLPKDADKNPNNMISILEQADFGDANPSKFFKNIERNGSSWTQKINNKEENIMYFGKTEVAPGELMDGTPTIETLCKVEYNPNSSRPYTVFIIDNINGEIEKVKTEMDQINFALFIASKKLSPRTKKDVEEQSKKAEGGPGQALPPKKIPISIASISGFMKTVSKKVSEGLKKFEEKQTDDLTEALMFEGKLMSKLAGIIPGDKMKFAFAKAGEEYLLERDNKVWKKVEDWAKFYESDPDFGGPKMRGEKIQPYLEGKIPFRNQRQAAGILLATIKKGKGPYSRNTDRAGKGMWIKILMGEAHQDRYLKMKEKLEKELKEGINVNGQQWANDKQNEILKLEMKYITHVVDGRQLRWTDEDVALQEGRFSKKFAGDLEERSNTFFKETASGAYNNTKDISFELARFEYFRLLGDRPQQAIANLKAVAEKAVTESQWKVFESMVLTGMLSGVFNSMTQEDKKFIEKVCRTAGFLPGLLMRQPNVHHKIAKLLTLASGKAIVVDKKEYNPSSFDFGKMENTGQIKSFVNYDKGFNKRYMENEKVIKAFLSFEGENADKKKLIEVYEDPNTPNDIKQILGEIIGKRYETNEELDSDVKGNGKSLQQNLLCRNQSLIDEIIRFQDGSFKGKDKDAIEDAKVTRKKITEAMKKNTISGKTDVIFTLKMFSNRFEDKGFNSEQKKLLIRLLKTVKEERKNNNTKGADQMLRYGIVGRIIRSSGSGQVPDELKAGLETFKDFFEKNLDTILSEEVINEGFGGAYVDSLEKPAFKVAPWDEYVKIMEYNKYGYSADLNKEENQEISRKKKEYSNPIVYINSTIYKMADELEKRDYGVPNAFKEMYDPEKDKKSTKKQLEEVLGKNAVALKNHAAIQKAEKRKNGPDDGLTDEERALYMANEDGGYPDY